MRHGSRSNALGYSLLEMVVATAVAAIFTLLTVPPILRWHGSLRVRMAAAQVESALHLARLWAIQHRSHVAVKFRTDGGGRVRMHLYRDGDGDGVRNRDIEAGIDPEARGPQVLGHFGDNVGFGFPKGLPPRDPSSPHRRLGRLEDPIRFNRSDLASFSPLGTATPGTVYITDHHRHLAMVRVTGTSGRIRLRQYDREGDRWRD